MDAQLFLDIESRLKTQVPTLRWFDIDSGQLNDENPPVSYPCALIDIQYPQCVDQGENEQNCITRVTIRYAFKTYSQSNDKAPAEVRTKAMEAWGLVSDCYSALQGFSTSSFSKFSRKRQVTERSKPGFKVIVQEWETTCEEIA